MVVESNNQRRFWLILLSLLIAGSAALLMPYFGVFPHLYVWPRVLLLALLLIGLAGSIWRMSPLLILGKIGGWIFVLYGFAGLPEPEDLPYSSSPKHGAALLEGRYVLFAVVAVGLLLCFSRLGRLHRPKETSS
jgi:hypothetical protein